MDKKRARPLAIYWNSTVSRWDVQLRNNGKTTHHGSSRCFGQAFAIRKQISRGGKHVPSNVVLCTKEVNQMKGTMTEAEFIAICLEIGSYG